MIKKGMAISGIGTFGPEGPDRGFPLLKALDFTRPDFTV
jgi:hypothetical protein